jgi:hypothetical protein
MIEIALLTSSLILAGIPRAAYQTAPLRSEDRLVVLVVDDSTGEPVADAEVVAYDLVAGQAQWNSRGYSTGYLEWRSDREQFGLRKRTDASGHARFASTDGDVALRAQAPGRWAEVKADGTARAPLELRLESDVTLEVAVVDGNGAPVGAVAVGLVERSADEPQGEEHEAAWVEWGDPADGVARFRHAQVVLRPRKDRIWIARLAIPLESPVEVLVDATKLGSERLRLVAPATGSFSIECPGIESGMARIRPASQERLGAWFSWEPLRAPLTDGKARFPHVGLKVAIEYEVFDARSDYKLHGKIAGPIDEDEHVVLACPSDELFPRFVGRLVDEDLVPLSDVEVLLTLTRRHKGATYSKGMHLTTDSEGGFDYVLRQDLLGTDKRPTIQFRSGQGESREIELAEELPPGRLELGDIQIVVPGSSRSLERMQDAALEVEYQRALQDSARNGTYRRSVEACMTEMARRGGEHWVTFLAAELARERRGDDASGVEDLELLTALRRSQGAGDPLVLELQGPSELECTFPVSPVVELAMKNADAQGETFQLSLGGSYRSGRFARCRVEAIDEEGRFIAPLPSPSYMGGGMMQRGPFKKGRSRRFGVPLGAYVQWPKPGSYRVRVLYHDQGSIDCDESVGGWILSTSPTFIVRVHPLVIRTSRAEQARLAEHIGAIDLSEPLLLVSGHWSPDLTFAAEPSTPQDHLFHSGWQSLPALLDALESDALEPRRRAWVLGMLWNLAGIHHPPLGAIGSSRWVESWPGASVAGQPSMAELGQTTGEPHREAQRELTQRWLALRSCIEVTLTD